MHQPNQTSLVELDSQEYLRFRVPAHAGSNTPDSHSLANLVYRGSEEGFDSWFDLARWAQVAARGDAVLILGKEPTPLAQIGALKTMEISKWATWLRGLLASSKQLPDAGGAFFQLQSSWLNAIYTQQRMLIVALWTQAPLFHDVREAIRSQAAHTFRHIHSEESP